MRIWTYVRFRILHSNAADDRLGAACSEVVAVKDTNGKPPPLGKGRRFSGIPRAGRRPRPEIYWPTVASASPATLAALACITPASSNLAKRGRILVLNSAMRSLFTGAHAADLTDLGFT